MRPDYIDNICSVLESEIKRMVKIVREAVFPNGHGQPSVVGPTYKAMRIVLVMDNRGSPRVCRREGKKEDEKELLLLRKRELREGGLSCDYWEKVIEKVAIALEKRGIINRSESVALAGQMALFEGK